MDYHVGFTALPSFGPRRLHRLFEVVRDWKVLWESSVSELVEKGLPREFVEKYATERSNVDIRRIVDDCGRFGIHFIWHEDADYPDLLKEIPDAPVGLYVRGKLSTLSHTIAVVGTRRPSPYGIRVTRMIAGELAASGSAIVSGLALGIDGIAHEAALESRGTTIAVLACGLDLIYPATHIRLGERIIERGSIVSEFPPRTPPLRHHFPIRNRIIAGLSSGILVTEAPLKSGALLTAAIALEYNRDIFAVPGPITSVTSAGTNELLRSGANVVTSAQDIRTHYHLGDLDAPPAYDEQLSDDERRVLHAFGAEPRSIDELTKISTLRSSAVSGALTLLELKGWVGQLDPVHYLRKR